MLAQKLKSYFNFLQSDYANLIQPNEILFSDLVPLTYRELLSLPKQQ